MRRFIQLILDALCSFSRGLMDIYPRWFIWTAIAAGAFAVMAIILLIAAARSESPEARSRLLVATTAMAALALPPAAAAYFAWRSQRRDWL